LYIIYSVPLLSFEYLITLALSFLTHGYLEVCLLVSKCMDISQLFFSYWFQINSILVRKHIFLSSFIEMYFTCHILPFNICNPLFFVFFQYIQSCITNTTVSFWTTHTVMHCLTSRSTFWEVCCWAISLLCEHQIACTSCMGCVACYHGATLLYVVC
jgi:hypothetical protein